MKRIGNGIVAFLALFVANFHLEPTAHARKEHNTAFWEMYPSMKELKEAQCGVCHGKEKKVRNDYGKAFETAIGGKNIKDAEKIKAALTKAESEQSATEGKTFGDLIKDGKLPGSATP